MTTEELAKETVTELNAIRRLGLTSTDLGLSREVNRLTLILTPLSIAEAAREVARLHTYYWQGDCVDRLKREIARLEARK